MKNILLIIAFVLVCGTASYSQTSCASCEGDLNISNQRLLKTLDAYEKAVAALNAATAEIDARKKLDGLKDELLAAKDQLIAAQAQTIKFYQSQKAKGKWRAAFERVEKLLILAAGIYVGKGL